MKKTTEQKLLCAVFCGFLFVMMCLYLVMPKQEFSGREKRYLAQTPKVSWEAVSSGEFADELDTFLADHIPGRNFFVGLNAYVELLTGRQKADDILLTGSRLVEAPVEATVRLDRANLSFRTFCRTPPTA